MIEIYRKNEDVKRYDSLKEIDSLKNSILCIRVIDFEKSDLLELNKRFDINLTSFKNQDDIEISSHYIESKNQVSLNFAIPNYSTEEYYQEEDVYILVKDDIVFMFLTSDFDDRLNQFTQFRYNNDLAKFSSYIEHFIFQISIVGDYYADIVELLSKEIKNSFFKTLKSTRYKEKDLDNITHLKYKNLQIMESLTEFQRILTLLVKNDKFKISKLPELSKEIEDLSVIADYIKYSFNRLDDLHGNINSKIELELSKIFKLLTMITISISLPTLIAGVYGMNFLHIPELNWVYGYPIILFILLISFIIPLYIFKRKKWL